MPIYLRIIFVGSFVILHGFLKQSKHARVTIGLYDFDDLGKIVFVVIHVCREFIVDSFFLLVFAKTSNIKLHHLLSQTIILLICGICDTRSYYILCLIQ